jgi:hypothetical protein
VYQAYSHRFDTIPGATDPLYLGATHFEDVEFVFDNVLGQGMPSNALDVQPAAREESYKQLGDPMSRMWMSFSATHSSNNHRGNYLHITITLLIYVSYKWNRSGLSGPRINRRIRRIWCLMETPLALWRKRTGALMR